MHKQLSNWYIRNQEESREFIKQKSATQKLPPNYYKSVGAELPQ
jgi:DNA-binding ferritin-like protein (Dps family)